MSCASREPSEIATDIQTDRQTQDEKGLRQVMNISCGAMWLSADRQDSWFMNCDAVLSVLSKQNSFLYLLL
jgi:hypothetical protein